ncbi:hypothetical protein N177_1501 [Lutibaculum baratangense AMV1]|uniref:Uncharacterized protein n=1 Tax=Lutibaculum baratangense AMV1 TaxID=631454 RepID=V4TI31_9HYPH|nr:hypothetical protein N177_1501 [Lutibaculum baratangense AMV1]
MHASAGTGRDAGCAGWGKLRQFKGGGPLYPVTESGRRGLRGRSGRGHRAGGPAAHDAGRFILCRPAQQVLVSHGIGGRTSRLPKGSTRTGTASTCGALSKLP